MAEATNFKNNKTGQQIDLVDQNARDQIEELNETLTEFAFLNETGERLPTDCDLNDYTTGGKYYSRNSSNSQNIANAPVNNSGFSLYILTLGLSNTVQIAITNSETIYYRVKDGSETEWRSWRRLSNEVV